jgi:serine/threonine protein kinase
MGSVYEGIDIELGRRVAIKVSDSHAIADRFRREARAIAALTHPNILQIFDYRVEANVAFFVTEMLEGVTLRQRLTADLRLSLSEAIAIADQVLAALAAAHDAGIVHRDVKPPNIFLCSSGVVKLLDFGLAGWKVGGVGSDAIGQLTSDGAICGTIGYLSPEQAMGESAEPSSDFFSLACVIYEMLTGQTPFRGSTPLESIHASLYRTPPFLRVALPKVPLWLESVVQHCLMKSPAERPASAGVLREAFTSYRKTGRAYYSFASPSLGTPIRLLILDDNPLGRELVRALGERRGHVVLTAASWLEFNRILAADVCDLIMIEEHVPPTRGSRGVELLRRDPANDHIPIILFSGKSEADLAVPLTQCHADYFIIKPITAEKLDRVFSLLMRPLSSEQQPSEQRSTVEKLPADHLQPNIDSDAPTPRVW